MRFITDNWGTIAAGVVVFGIAALSVIKLIRDKQKGKSCSCGCSGCTAKSSCE